MSSSNPMYTAFQKIFVKRALRTQLQCIWRGVGLNSSEPCISIITVTLQVAWFQCLLPHLHVRTATVVQRAPMRLKMRRGRRIELWEEGAYGAIFVSLFGLPRDACSWGVFVALHFRRRGSSASRRHSFRLACHLSRKIWLAGQPTGNNSTEDVITAPMLSFCALTHTKSAQHIREYSERIALKSVSHYPLCIRITIYNAVVVWYKQPIIIFPLWSPIWSNCNVPFNFRLSAIYLSLYSDI